MSEQLVDTVLRDLLHTKGLSEEHIDLMMRCVKAPAAVEELFKYDPITSGSEGDSFCASCDSYIFQAHDADCTVDAAQRALGLTLVQRSDERAHDEALREKQRREAPPTIFGVRAATFNDYLKTMYSPGHMASLTDSALMGLLPRNNEPLFGIDRAAQDDSKEPKK